MLKKLNIFNSKLEIEKTKHLVLEDIWNYYWITFRNPTERSQQLIAKSKFRLDSPQ